MVRAVKINTRPTTIALFEARTESINILPIPGKAKIVSVKVAPVITLTIDAGIPETKETIAFLKMCLFEISCSDNPLARAKRTKSCDCKSIM